MKNQASGPHWVISMGVLFWAEVMILSYNLTPLLAMLLGIVVPIPIFWIAWFVLADHEEAEDK